MELVEFEDTFVDQVLEEAQEVYDAIGEDIGQNMLIPY